VLGLVERFHRTWKDCISLHVREEQDDWDDWIECAVYAYNSAVHSTTHFTPNELMMGRRLRSPNELLRRDRLTEVDNASDYHERLVTAMERSLRAAREATTRSQLTQAYYYNRNVRKKRQFRVGDLVWVYERPRGPKYSHRWLGPVEVIGSAGYDNLLVRRRDLADKVEDIVTHVSFVASYYTPDDLLLRLANDLAIELDEERDVALSQWPRASNDSHNDTETSEQANRERDGDGEGREDETEERAELQRTRDARYGTGNNRVRVGGEHGLDGESAEARDGECNGRAALVSDGVEPARYTGGSEQNNGHDRGDDGTRDDDGGMRRGEAIDGEDEVIYAFAANGHVPRRKRRHRTYPPATVERLWGGPLVERRRRRRRNRVGRYVLEFEVEPRELGTTASERWLNSRRRWVGIDQFERLWRSGRVVEDSGFGEAV